MPAPIGTNVNCVLVSFSIRPARESDAEEISALIVSLSHYFLSEPNSPEIGPFLKTLTPAATAERIGSDTFSCFVAEIEHEICGVMAVRNKNHVYHLFVQSQMHRKGIARALWEYVRTQFETEAFTVNSSLYAVPIYERLGFKVVKQPQNADGLVFVPMEFRHDS